ncbi:LuxR C-terminal-related transcriptional regulator [Streptomyces sp. NPDC090306]|uniref:LuxR C-terminal-related transcriptional regulator n=1 Tax=Streptomyces sp. NPDC090306 TaxID=3365961 RepID=UPI00382E477E
MTGQTTVRTLPRIHSRNPRSTTADDLLERRRTDLLERLAAAGPAHVVTGEPGLGRGALLDRAARSFGAGRVLRLRAAPGGPRPPYGDLRTLERAAAGFPGRPAAPPGPATPARTVAALRAAADGGPLLVCLDDAHLWDPSSRTVLGHAAGLLGVGDRIRLLLGVAGHRPVDREFAGLPVVAVPPLSPPDAAALVDEVTGRTAERGVRDALVEESDGNPALLLALVRRLSPAELAGERPLPWPLADAEVLAGVAGDAWPGPAGAADGLLLAVAAAARDAEDAGADADLVLRAARQLCSSPAAADHQRVPDTLLLADGRFRFLSGLLRRAVYAGARADRRRAAHRSLARALEADGRPLRALLHRAWATTGPAPLLASQLACAATDTEVAASHRLRSAALVRAAELTANGAVRAERWTAAAEQALLGGSPRRALRLLAAQRHEPMPPVIRGRGELVRGRAELRDGPVRDAHESLLLAASLLAAESPERAELALQAAADAGWAAGDAAACLRALEAGRARPAESGPAAAALPATGGQGAGGPVPPGPPGALPAPAALSASAVPAASAVPRPRSASGPLPGGAEPCRGEAAQGRTVARDYRDGMSAALEVRFDRAGSLLRRVVDAAATSRSPEDLLRSAAAALILGEVDAACRAGARALAVARTLGSAALAPQALEYLAYAELRAGRHAQARAHAEEGLRIAQRHGQRNQQAQHHAVLALAASIEGEPEVVAEHVGAALATARRHGLAQVSTLAQWAAARVDLGRGHPLEAVDRLGPLVAPGPRRGHFAVWMLAVPCFVEASALAGQPEGARAAVEDFALWAAFGADPQAPAQLARCRALLAPTDRADDLYARALALHDERGGTFERARTELLYGKWLRRRRRLREARARLGAALVGFEDCGAGVWAGQAREELRANGAAPGATRPADTSGLAGLTPQQWRVARLVAEGATNREVARALSVSARTVDYHLRNVFAALGVRSRVELARLVEQAEKAGAQTY